MIGKITDFESLSGVLSPLLPLIYTDGLFSQNDLDGAFFQKSGTDETQAIFSLKNTCVTLHVMSNNGIDELESFFNFFGVTEILSDKPLHNVFKEQKQLFLLEFSGDIPEEMECALITPKSTVNEYKNVYDVVFQEGNNFENWFPEFSKKVNYLNAAATYLEVERKVVSAAVSPSIYANSAIIAGVFTLKEYRNKGFASACVKGLLKELSVKDISKIYLWCEEENLPFYEKIGFRAVDKIYFGECN